MNQRYELLLLSFLLYLSFNSSAQVTLEAAYPTTDLHRVNWTFGGEKYWYSNDSLKEIKVFSAQHQLLKTIRYPSVLNSQIRLLQNEQAVTQTTVNGDNLLEIIWFFKDTLTKKEQMKIINEKDSVLFIFGGVSDNVQLSEIDGLPSKIFVSIYDLGLETYTTKVYALPSLNLENIYFNAYRLHRKKFGYAGEKYFFQDAENKKMRLFNPDHSHWKNINLNYQNLTLYPSDNCVDADDNVFSKDSLVEVVFCYDVGVNYGEAILNENGSVIYKITSNTIALDQKKGLNSLLFEEVYYPTKSNDFRVLSLPDFTVKAISSYPLSRAFLKKYGETIYTFEPFQNQLKLFYNTPLVQKTINLQTLNPNRVVYPYSLLAYNDYPIVSDSIINKDSLTEIVYIEFDKTNNRFSTKIVNDTGFIYKIIENTRIYEINTYDGLIPKLVTKTGATKPFETKIWRLGNLTSTKEAPSVLGVKIYPNPFSNDMTIEIAGNKVSPFNIRLLNVLGEVMYETKTNDERVYLSMPNLSKGLYFLEVVSGNQRSVSKVVKVGF